jgi:hypothetical protein
MKNDVYTDLETNTPKDDGSLYGFVFHFNHYSGLWSAIPRDQYNQYWSDSKTDGVLRSKNMETLVEIIQKTRGDKSLLEQLTREQ